MPEVFPIVPNWPLSHELTVDTFVADFGGGFEQRANFDTAYTRANGQGGVTSYKGRNRFTIRLKAMDYSSDASTLWAFYIARTGNLQAFYFYHVPHERATIDLTGADTVGRYLVRFEHGNLSRENFTRALFSTGISLLEVRS